MPQMFPCNRENAVRLCFRLYLQQQSAGQSGAHAVPSGFYRYDENRYGVPGGEEIISWKLRQLNPSAAIFPVDGLAGYGAEALADWLLSRPEVTGFENDILRHTMPGGVCSYCVGETRVGSAFQQGGVGKIQFKEERSCGS